MCIPALSGLTPLLRISPNTRNTLNRLSAAGSLGVAITIFCCCCCCCCCDAFCKLSLSALVPVISLCCCKLSVTLLLSVLLCVLLRSADWSVTPLSVTVALSDSEVRRPISAIHQASKHCYFQHMLVLYKCVMTLFFKNCAIEQHEQEHVMCDPSDMLISYTTLDITLLISRHQYMHTFSSSSDSFAAPDVVIGDSLQQRCVAAYTRGHTITSHSFKHIYCCLTFALLSVLPYWN
jgi:hypothetical protein